MNTYTACLLLIQKKVYKSKADMSYKLNVFFLNDQITELQYNELISLINVQEST